MGEKVRKQMDGRQVAPDASAGTPLTPKERCRRRRVLAFSLFQIAAVPIFVVYFPSRLHFKDDVVDLSLAGTEASAAWNSYLDAWSRLANFSLRAGLVPVLAVDAPEPLPGDTLSEFERPPSVGDGVTSDLNTSSKHRSRTDHFSLHILYHSLDGNNLLAIRKLLAIRRLEQRLRDLPGWRSWCKSWQAEHTETTTGTEDHPEGVGLLGGGCDPGESIAALAWPSRNSSGDQTSIDHFDPNEEVLRFTGSGFQRLSIEVVLGAFIFAGVGDPANRAGRVIPQDIVKASVGLPAVIPGMKADMTQSHFLFSWRDSENDSSSYYESFGDFVANELHPALVSEGQKLFSEDGIKVRFWGTHIAKHEFWLQLSSDCWCLVLALCPLFLCLVSFIFSSRKAILVLLFALESMLLILVFILSCVEVGISVVGITLGFVFPVFAVDFIMVMHLALQECQPGQSDDPPEFCPRSRLTFVLRVSIAPFFVFIVSVAAVVAGEPALFRQYGLLFGFGIVSIVLAAVPASLILPLSPPLLRPSSATVASYCGANIKFFATSLSSRIRCCRWILGHKERKFAGEWPRSMRKWRWFIASFFLVVSTASLVHVCTSAAMDASILEVLPADHRYVAVKSLLEKFSPIASVDTAASSLGLRAMACPLQVLANGSAVHGGGEIPCQDIDPNCGAWASSGRCGYDAVRGWCNRSCGVCPFCMFQRCWLNEVPILLENGRRDDGPLECLCSHLETNAETTETIFDDDSVSVRPYIAGLPTSAWQRLRPELDSFLSELTGSSGTFVSDIPVEGAALVQHPPLVQEHWRSGRAVVMNLFEGVSWESGRNKSAQAVPKSDSKDARPVPILCGCGGVPHCSGLKPVGGFRTGIFREPAVPPAFPSRGAGVDLVRVSVVWGIMIQGASRLPQFNAFRPEDPWAQRAMMTTALQAPTSCDSFPEELNGITWLLQLETWLRERQDSFPTRSFHSQVIAFVHERADLRRNVLIIHQSPNEGRVAAMRIGFVSKNIGTDSSFEDVMHLRRKWDVFMKDRDRDSSENAKNVWHTSHSWLRVDATQSLGISCMIVVITVVVLNFLVTALTTSVIPLALLILVSSCSCVLVQISVALLASEWQTGTPEVFAFLLSFGHQVSVAIHFIVHYSRVVPQAGSDDRLDRVTKALSLVWSRVAALGASVAIASLSMCLCQLQFLHGFGVAMAPLGPMIVLHVFVILPAAVVGGPSVQLRPSLETARCICNRCHFQFVSKLKILGGLALSIWSGAQKLVLHLRSRFMRVRKSTSTAALLTRSRSRKLVSALRSRLMRVRKSISTAALCSLPVRCLAFVPSRHRRRKSPSPKPPKSARAPEYALPLENESEAESPKAELAPPAAIKPKQRGSSSDIVDCGGALLLDGSAKQCRPTPNLTLGALASMPNFDRFRDKPSSSEDANGFIT